MLPPLAATLLNYGLTAKKSLGQHFLLDERLTARIAACAGNVSHGTTLEIGPGPGGLTRALLAAGAKVIAVEKDARCIAALGELAACYPGRLEILEKDALRANLQALAPAPRRIVANLPYNVGTALLAGWLEEIALSEGGTAPYLSLTLMFQREVAQRIGAAAGGKDYGRISVLSQWLCEVTHHFDLPPGAFTPPPKVYSSVITLVPRAVRPHSASLRPLEKVLAAAFNQRRKMLRQSLKPLGGEALLRHAGIDPTRRAETLSVEEFCTLSRLLPQHGAHPGLGEDLDQ